MGMGRQQAEDLKESPLPRFCVCWCSGVGSGEGERRFRSRRKQVRAEHLVTVQCIPGKSFNGPIPRDAWKITGKCLL